MREALFHGWRFGIGHGFPLLVHLMMQHADSGDGLQGKYKDDGANDTLMAASYIGREWSNLAPFDANAPGGAS